MNEVPITWNADDMHAAFCRALGHEPGHGSKAAIARDLGVPPQRYDEALRGKRDAAYVVRLCMVAGIALEVVPHEVQPTAGADVLLTGRLVFDVHAPSLA